MKKLSFYLENGGIPEVDFSKPELGNPGCGGTEYATASLVYELSKRNLFKITVYSQANFYMHNVENILVKNLGDALEFASSRGDVFVFRANIHPNISILESLRKSKVSAIIWLHVTPTFEHISQLAGIKQVKALVTMSERQRYKWLDSPAAKKTLNIMNGQYPSRISRVQDYGQTVTYLGALVPQKGFHILAEIWPNVVRKVPGATLRVVGSGALYNHGAKLGELGIAGAEYESLIVSNLGSAIKSVEFFGRVSNAQKDEIISNTAVGVVNPSGLTENCPASVLDFQSAGVPVISAKKNGLIDTVLDGVSGKLITNKRQLESAIIKLLTDKKLNSEYSWAGPIYIAEKFNFSSICNSWTSLILSIQNDKDLPIQKVPRPIGVKEHLIFMNMKIGESLSPSYRFVSISKVEDFLRKLARSAFRRNS